MTRQVYCSKVGTPVEGEKKSLNCPGYQLSEVWVNWGTDWKKDKSERAALGEPDSPTETEGSDRKRNREKKGGGWPVGEIDGKQEQQQPWWKPDVDPYSMRRTEEKKSGRKNEKLWEGGVEMKTTWNDRRKKWDRCRQGERDQKRREEAAKRDRVIDKGKGGWRGRKGERLRLISFPKSSCIIQTDLQ